MKNLLIFISPTKSFDNPRPDLTANDAGQLVKIQIENSLQLGWNKDDIMLVTNFPFEYAGIKSIVLQDVGFFERKPQVSKINAIAKLFEEGQIKKRELYWFHDLDAFQLEQIDPKEIDIKSNVIAMTDFGGAKHFLGTDRWSGGIIYFKDESYDIFREIQKLCYQKQIDEEEAIGILFHDNNRLAKRIKKINNSYNFIGYNLKSVYEKSFKPLKVVHFHPTAPKKRFGNIIGLNFFMGENPLGIRLITPNLLEKIEIHSLNLNQKNEIPSVAIIIPTYKRSHKLVAVYKNAKLSSPLVSEVYFVIENDDRESAITIKRNRLPFFRNERSKNYAGAFNTAFSKIKEKYVFIGSDDLDFKSRWLENCLAKMGSPIKIVGTNDMHNINVRSGVYATHFLIDREYLSKYSGIDSDKNMVLYEGYAHNYIDREFVEVAKMRGVFATGLDAIVEHLHWGYGLSPNDETYSNQGSLKSDHKIYRDRMALWSEKIKAEKA